MTTNQKENPAEVAASGEVKKNHSPNDSGNNHSDINRSLAIALLECIVPTKFPESDYFFEIENLTLIELQEICNRFEVSLSEVINTALRGN